MWQTKWARRLCFTLLGTLSATCCCSRSCLGITDDLELRQISFQLYNDNLIVTKGKIGSIDVNVVVDTGTSPTAISTEIAGRLDLRGKMEPLLSSTGQIDVQSVMLTRIDVGALHRKSIRVVVQDLSFMQHSIGIPIGGIVGLDVLGSGSFMIDYGRRRISFEPRQQPKRSAPFERQSPYITVSAKIGGETFRLLVDSGTPGLLLFHNRLNGKSAKLERLISAPKASMLTPVGRMRAEWFRVSEVWLGGENIGPQILLVADGDPDPRYEFDGLLGLAKTGFQKVWLDFEHGLFGWDSMTASVTSEL